MSGIKCFRMLHQLLGNAVSKNMAKKVRKVEKANGAIKVRHSAINSQYVSIRYRLSISTNCLPKSVISTNKTDHWCDLIKLHISL